VQITCFCAAFQFLRFFDGFSKIASHNFQIQRPFLLGIVTSTVADRAQLVGASGSR
jgi:hypothetical protein